jgi:hypothetical protein
MKLFERWHTACSTDAERELDLLRSMEHTASLQEMDG